MDPFHVVRLAGDTLERCRQRVQQQTLGRRGRRNDPLFTARRTLLTGNDLLTQRQRDRLLALFDGDAHVEVEATWGVYQQIVAAYRESDKDRGKMIMKRVIDTISAKVPAALVESASSAALSNSGPAT